MTAPVLLHSRWKVFKDDQAVAFPKIGKLTEHYRVRKEMGFHIDHTDETELSVGSDDPFICPDVGMIYRICCMMDSGYPALTGKVLNGCFGVWAGMSGGNGTPLAHLLTAEYLDSTVGITKKFCRTLEVGGLFIPVNDDDTLNGILNVRCAAGGDSEFDLYGTVTFYILKED